MLLRKLLSSVYRKVRARDYQTLSRKIKHGYHVKNWVERQRNRKLLRKARKNFNWHSDGEPLVSVIIPTYNRSKLLAERAIPSVLAQTYQNFELIIVGDCCTDDTEQRVKEFNDARIKFVNLPERGRYPEKNPWDAWMVAGSVPRNRGLELASGQWIAPLDDDDEFSKDHIEVLLSHALQGRFEMVYGIVEMEIEPGMWVRCGSYPLRFTQISHMSVLYRSELRFFKYDVNSWKYNEPDDWNLWRRMKEAGVKIGFIDRVVGRHYLERKHWNIK